MLHTLLLISNHHGIKEKINHYLENTSIRLEHAQSSEQGIALWQKTKPDLVIIDSKLSHLNGVDICEIITEKKEKCEVLFVNLEEHKIQALKHVPNEANEQEIQLIINGIENLLELNKNHEYSFDGHLVDYKNYKAINRNKLEYYLSEHEIGIFRLFASKPEQLIKREEILEHVWQDDIYPSSITIEKKINKLRKVFETNPQSPKYFNSVLGMGYKFTPKGNN